MRSVGGSRLPYLDDDVSVCDCCNSLVHDERDSLTSFHAFATDVSPASQTSSLAECSELLSCIGEMEEFNLESGSWS